MAVLVTCDAASILAPMYRVQYVIPLLERVSSRRRAERLSLSKTLGENLRAKAPCGRNGDEAEELRAARVRGATYRHAAVMISSPRLHKVSDVLKWLSNRKSQWSIEH